MAPDLKRIVTTDATKRKAGGWYQVAVYQLGSSRKAAYAIVATRTRTRELPAPTAFNLARTEVINTLPIDNLAVAIGMAQGFALGRWGRWSL